MIRLAAGTISLLCAAVALAEPRADGRSAGATAVSALAVVVATTPRLRVPRYDTSGTYPQVRGGGIDLRAANAGLREAVLADQRNYAPYARR